MFLTSFLAQEMHCCLFPRRKVKFEDNATFVSARDSEIIPEVFAVILGQETKDFGVFVVFLKYLTLSLKCPAITL